MSRNHPDSSSTQTARLPVVECTAVIFDPLAYPGDLHVAINRLADHFAELAGFSHDPALPSESGSEIRLATGTVISPFDAANCMRDIRRTTSFLRGIHQAIDHLLKTRTERPLNVLYAGCGPFATLVTPLLHRFHPGDVQFQLLDIQPGNIEMSRRLIQGLGCEDYLSAWHLHDATSWQHDATTPLHLVITETMQAALAKECQVSIAANLAPQLCPGGIMIPERIQLDAVLFVPAHEFSIERMQGKIASKTISMGIAFELDHGSALAIHEKWGPDFPEGAWIPGFELCVPASKSADQEVWITTRIDVFGDHRIEVNDSGLTVPKPAEIRGGVRAGDRLRFGYALGRSPHLYAEAASLSK